MHVNSDVRIDGRWRNMLNTLGMRIHLAMSFHVQWTECEFSDILGMDDEDSSDTNSSTDSLTESLNGMSLSRSMSPPPEISVLNSNDGDVPASYTCMTPRRSNTVPNCSSPMFIRKQKGSLLPSPRTVERTVTTLFQKSKSSPSVITNNGKSQTVQQPPIIRG